jgi:hypothetical protein
MNKKDENEKSKVQPNPKRDIKLFGKRIREGS